ncbi:hypothetical protein DFA_11506 [Cavenderia fasciculata]|uniref:Complex 1 LYR protein domain-containing protein n=1 Tax=Cavenderia fasciculata TaxID=261658 RepID=F4QDB7_CACFS|nr:uncharacterized protein DFA_11506 [Cavenderia fasciculata]EGG13745.1 hypothetical protein DFA_11506 [Cavenderia fasciculata]|eukprot:XP_004350450.1 hypothetical protein DFA_11506 [Cavenderia fasciculata]
MSGATQISNPLIQKSVVHIYRDCIRLARYIGQMNGYTRHIPKHVAGIFREHKFETNPEKIEEYKVDATRFISNFMQHEAERLAKDQKAALNSKQRIPKSLLLWINHNNNNNTINQKHNIKPTCTNQNQPNQIKLILIFIIKDLVPSFLHSHNIILICIYIWNPPYSNNIRVSFHSFDF